MAERSSSLACKKFSANVFDKNKCQNCFKPKDVHHDATTSPTQPQRPTTLEVGVNRSKTTVKSGSLCIATQVSTLPNVQVQKWETVWFMLYSSGDLEWFSSEATKASLGKISLDDCTGLTSAEVDTMEPFSIGIKTSAKTHYLKAENRLEMDNWCRVLKPFVIASPGYRFSKKTPPTRTVSYHDSKISSPNIVQERKSSLSRTVSAPWHASSDQKNASGLSVNNLAKKRWSATEELLVKREASDKNTKIITGETEATNSSKKQVETQVKTAEPTLQPYYSDIYLKPDPSEQKQNGETTGAISTLETELTEAKRVAKLNQGKAEMCSKNLTDTKKQLEKANNVISIQKVNLETLTAEVETLKTRLKRSDEVVEKRLKELESRYPTCNGNDSQDSIESGFIKLQSKLQENEKALIRRTRELEKANESRKKVAKHTRALLVELEEKLTGNSSRINELEEQLMNKTLDLQYERDERQRIEREKGQLANDLSVSNLHSKQREITKRSTELLQKARDDHKHSKNEQKFQHEIDGLHQKLEAKNFEIQRLRERVVLDKKDGEIQKIEAAYKKASDQVDALRTELGLVNESFSKERTKCSELESRVQDVSMKVKERDEQTNEIQKQNAELKSEIERTRQECETQVLLLQEDNETTRIRLHEVQEELDSLHTEADGHNPNEFEELSRDFEELKSNSLKRENECIKLRDSQKETVRDFNNEKNRRLKLEKDFEENTKELKNSQKELEKLQELLRTAEGKCENESKRVSELEEICKSNKLAGEKLEAKNTQDLDKLRAKIQNYQTEIKEIKEKHDERNRNVLDLNKGLENRLKGDEEVLSKITTVESSLRENHPDLFGSNKKALSNCDENKRERTNVLDAIECLNEKIEILKSSFKEEKEKVGNLERSLQAKESSARRCSVCEKRKNETSSLVEELEETKEAHRKEVERLEKSIKSESQTSKGHAEELKLKLTSKVILLQSDISELNAKHERELNQVKEQRKQEVESLRTKYEQEVTQANEQHKQVADSWREKHQSELNLANERHKKDIEAWREKCESRAKQEVESLQKKYEQEVTQTNEERKQVADSWREKHESELNLANERHKQEIEAWREKCESSNASEDEIDSLREKIGQLEAQLLSERESNEQRITTLKQDYEAKGPAREVHENGDVGLGELQDQHSKELEEIKENHRKELEENKCDMMMVLQALKSDSYQSSSMSSESLEMNDELKKLERYVETLKQEHGQEIERLNQEHEQDLEQLRSDMVTLLRVQETYKTPDEGKADPNGNIVDLDGQLAVMKRSHDKEIRAKEAQHQNEVDQLKSDMLVAIQAASAVANISSKASTSSPDERVTELEQYVANLEREFEEERENLQNTIKKAESATKFGLRRNEEMSNKIYQMQREMEEIDTKYQKEVKLYKEAFDQEKNRKTTIGAVPGILAENESLKVKLQELELTMEQTQVRYDSEIKRYKEKFQQENVLTVEELQFRIKSLEDGIEQMRLEHETELEKYTKAVRRGKVSLTSTVKERDLERKIDDLESKFDVMRQKHREEVRKYRERLEDEMERHRKESRASQRKAEADTRQMEDLKNKITELENKTGKLTKEASKIKEQETELAETKGKNRELQRQVDALKRKLDKLQEEATEENKETSTEPTVTSAKAKLSRYSSCDNIGSRTKSPPAGEVRETANSEDDVFELNNNSGKSEIGGYKLNPGLKRPASVSAFPVQTENGSRRTTSTYTEKRRDSGSTSNRSSYQPSYLKSSTSTSSLK